MSDVTVNVTTDPVQVKVGGQAAVDTHDADPNAHPDIGSSVYRKNIIAIGTAAAATNWSLRTQRSDRWLAAARITNSSSTSSEITFDVDLSAGTWTLTLMHFKDANRGIYTVTFDGTEVGTIDGYASAGTASVDSITGITVAAAGNIAVKLAMATKNASSAGFYGDISAIELVRTA